MLAQLRAQRAEADELVQRLAERDAEIARLHALLGASNERIAKLAQPRPSFLSECFGMGGGERNLGQPPLPPDAAPLSLITQTGRTRARASSRRRRR